MNYIEDCDCPIECQKTGFSYSTSFSQFPSNYCAQQFHDKYLSSLAGNNSSVMDFNSYYNYLKENELYMRIYFEESTETVVSQDPKYQTSDLISNLGGTIGLFTGFSFLSLIEIIEILANIGFILYENKRKKKIDPENNLKEENKDLTEINKIIDKRLESLLKLVLDLNENKIRINKIDRVNEKENLNLSQIIDNERSEMERVLANMGYNLNENKAIIKITKK